jgi:hypothetical protein
MQGEVTRRELARDGVSLGVGMAGAGAVLSAPASAAKAGVSAAQIETQALSYALQIEQLVVIAYRQAVASRYVGAVVKAQLRTHLGQEYEHVNVLERALTARGDAVPPAPSLSAAQAALEQHQVHWSLTQLRRQHDFLKLLVDMESLAENVYFQAVGKLQDLALAGTCAEIMGCEAQHWTVLSGFLNHQDATKAVPYPFVEGTP